MIEWGMREGGGAVVFGEIAQGRNSGDEGWVMVVKFNACPSYLALC